MFRRNWLEEIGINYNNNKMDVTGDFGSDGNNRIISIYDCYNIIVLGNTYNFWWL